jgi:hypothetical protein
MPTVQPRPGRCPAVRRAPDTSGPQPCAAASNLTQNGEAYPANELASHYYMSPLYGLGDLGGWDTKQDIRLAHLPCARVFARERPTVCVSDCGGFHGVGIRPSK